MIKTICCICLWSRGDMHLEHRLLFTASQSPLMLRCRVTHQAGLWPELWVVLVIASEYASKNMQTYQGHAEQNLPRTWCFTSLPINLRTFFKPVNIWGFPPSKRCCCCCCCWTKPLRCEIRTQEDGKTLNLNKKIVAELGPFFLHKIKSIGKVPGLLCHPISRPAVKACSYLWFGHGKQRINLEAFNQKRR